MPADDAVIRRNRLLASLPESERAALAERSEVRGYETRQMIFEEDEPITHVIFPLDGVFSLVSVMENGDGVELATVGNEGFVGLPVFLQAALTTGHRAFSQISGQAVTMAATDFMELANSGGGLQAALQRYTQALITQIAQGAACNRLHALEQRCARWLLQTHDRVDADDLSLTQEFLAQMLGVGRPAVNTVARAMQDAGMIRYSRGRITVLDREALEATTCECYGIITREYRRLLGED